MPEGDDSILPDYQPWIQSASAQAEELQKNLVDGKDQAIQSARVHIGQLYDASSVQLGIVQEAVNKASVEYRIYENLFFDKLKEGVYAARDHPNVAYGLGITGSLLLMRRPRRFLWRNTIGRFQTEEHLVTTAEKQVKELRQSVDLLKNEGKKLEERARLAEEELTRGRSKLKNAGSQLRGLVSTVYKTERQAKRTENQWVYGAEHDVGLVDDLRELPGRQALKLRAEVASMAAEAKAQRSSLDKDVVKIANKYGINV